MVIYKITNNTNNKVYIGQTKNFNHRMIAHKSDSTNKKSHSYYLPLYCAIRKYGWENFSKEIIEENNNDNISELELSEWANKREIYYINLYNSINKANGYNISAGGGQSPKGKLSLEEKVNLSKVFNIKEVKQIQQMLLKGIPRKEILNQFSPKLTDSFLDNINSGINFRDPSLNYPLFDYLHSKYSVKFTKEEQKNIINEIKNGVRYKDISDKWGISIGLISLINNGSIWTLKDCDYPLCVKGSSRLHNLKDWVNPMIKDLESSNLNLKEISKKYNKGYSTVKKINEGRSYKDNTKIYPLTKNRKK